MAWSSVETVPSPPDTTMVSNPSMWAQTSSEVKLIRSSILSTHSSPGCTSALMNWKMASEPKPDFGLWMTSVRTACLPRDSRPDYVMMVCRSL